MAEGALCRPTPALDHYLITNDINLRRQPSLRSQLNQIRMWVRQGRTDAWIAHKLDVSVDELARFKRDHDLEADGDGARARPADPLSVPPPEPRAEEPEEPEEEDEEEEPEPQPRRRSRGRRRGRRGGRPSADEAADEADEDEELVPAVGPGDGGQDEDEDEVEVEVEDGAPRKRRRRGRRGGRRHRARRDALEATFDHGEEGYGLWLDPAVADNPVYSEHWAGHRAVTVTVEPEAITIRRADAGRGAPAEDQDSDE